MLHGSVGVAHWDIGVLLIVFLWLLTLARLEGCGWVLFLDHPVENEIVLVSHAIEEILEELAEVANIGLLLELETAAVVHVNGEFFRISLCQGLDRSRKFLVSDLLVLLFLGLSRETLPRKAASAEVHKHESERLKIVSS